jgi:hypothetical protein
VSIAVITIRQDEGSDDLDISVDFEPRFKGDDIEANPMSHLIAMRMVEAAGEAAGDPIGPEHVRRVE